MHAPIGGSILRPHRSQIGLLRRLSLIAVSLVSDGKPPTL
jgi:hypothetical protein